MRPSVLSKTEASAWSSHSAVVSVLTRCHSKHDGECMWGRKRIDIGVGGGDCTVDK